MEWDVKIGDEIEFFDPNLSYELTKYRPINGESGLDFDPNWFREDAITKLAKNTYSGLITGTKSHRDFWKDRFDRCTNGFEINGYRITGDNYFWLNFYRLKQSIEGEKASAGRTLSFPMFLAFQYEYFHYVEICETLDKDVGLLKARALGFSEMAASLCARPYITTPNYRVVASAFSERHLKPLLNKIWAQLDWLNDETETAFKRVRMSQNTAMYKRASKRDKEGVESGHLAEIEGIVADSAEKIRGDRTERLFYEEAGSDKVFKQKWIQGEALITVLGGDRIGTRIGWGTGGDKGPALEGIRDMVTDPDSFNVLKYKHNYTPDGRTAYTAMFIPAYRMVKHLMDKRGWCDPVDAQAWYNKQREKKASDPSGLLMYQAEYCYTIDEALIQQGDNLFPREELAAQQAAITIYKTVPVPTIGTLAWKTSDGNQTNELIWRNGDNGKIFITEHPLRSHDGDHYKNLYVGGIDSIDIGKDDSSSDKNPSDFCIVIKKRVHGLSEPQYVAVYKDRPRDPREAYENAAKLLTYYNCQAVLEATRTAILMHFKNRKYMHLLMRRPKATMPDVAKGNSKMYGTPTPVKVIAHYRELIYDFILDYCHTIAFPEMVDQLLRYSDEKKKDFDIIAAMGMAELGDEEMSTKKPEPVDQYNKQFRDIGWFKDSKGYRHYGVIPKTEQERYAQTRVRKEDSWLYKDTL